MYKVYEQFFIYEKINKYNCSFLLKHPDCDNRTDTLSWNGTKPTYTTQQPRTVADLTYTTTNALRDLTYTLAKALETPPTPWQKP
jgi:hypothetical protein